MKLNRKGYMLVEIIISAALAMGIAYYLLNLTYKFKNVDEDVYQSIIYVTDKDVITKNIMNDLERGTISNVIFQTGSISRVTFQLNLTPTSLDESPRVEQRRLEIKQDSLGKWQIQYGKWNPATSTYDTADVSYYLHQIEESLIVDTSHITIKNSTHSLAIQIPIYSIYNDDRYTIKLFAQK